MGAKSLQSGRTLCYLWTVAHQAPRHGILQASILEWVAISSSRGPSQLRDRTTVSSIPCIGRRVFFFFFTTSATWEALGSVNTGVYDHEPLMVLIKLLEFRELQKTCSLNLTTPGVQEKEKILWKGIHAAHTHLGQNLGPGRLSVRPPNELSTCRTKL